MQTQGVVLLCGYAASALVFATFFMRLRTRLRQIGIASNVAFIVYGVVGHVIPVLVLHALLLPLNAWRLCEIVRTKARLQAALDGDLRPEWFEHDAPLIELSAGEQLFARSDFGHSMYLVLAGTMRSVGTGMVRGPGSIVGEVAVFSPSAKRIDTVVAATDARLLAVGRTEVVALYRRHPAIGAYLLRSMASRLSEEDQLRALLRA